MLYLGETGSGKEFLEPKEGGLKAALGPLT